MSQQDNGATSKHNTKPSISLRLPITEDAGAHNNTHLKTILFIVLAIHMATLRNPIHLCVRRNPLVKPNTDT